MRDKRALLAALALWGCFSVSAVAQTDPDAPPLPQPRPEGLGQDIEEEPPSENADEESAANDGDDAPVEEETVDERIYQTACPALLSGRIVGKLLPPIEEEGQCGLNGPIRLEAVVVNGHEIALPGTPTTNCTMATAFADWVEQIDAYTRGAMDSRVTSIATGPGYVCRLRYGADDGFVSEHARGNAIDVSDLTLADDTHISVLDDWSVAPLEDAAKFLAFAHGAACSGFTTVLGPEANSAHEDHFHFDLGCHGQSCTARICN